KALGETQNGGFIETVPKIGYRFKGNVTATNGLARTLALVEIEKGSDRSSRTGTVASAASAFRGRTVMIVALISVLSGGLALLGFKYFGVRATEPFQKIAVSKVTATGKDSLASISPDGTNLAYRHSESGMSSLWLRNLPSGAEKQLVEPSKSEFESLVFSPQGDSVYFTQSERNEAAALFELPILGGGPKRLIDNVFGRVSFSPDGGRLAFIRVESVNSAWDVITASAAGGQEKTVARSFPAELIRFPAWSPAGDKLAAFKMNREADGSGNRYSIVEIDVDDGSIVPITSVRWQSFGDIVWTNDGTGMIFAASDRIGAPAQIWYLDRATGAARKLTNDTDNYSNISLYSRSGNIAASKTERLSGIWITGDDNDPDNLMQIATAADLQEGDWGVTFGPEDKILYTGKTDGNWDVWTMNPDGRGRKRLTVSDLYDIEPSVVPDTGEIIFVSQAETGMTHIWKMASDGGGKTQLTSQLYEDYGVVTPDSKWMIYFGADNVKEERLWKLPIGGGEAIQISDRTVRSKVAVSPDSKWIAFASHDATESGKLKIFVIPLDGGGPTKILDMTAGFIPNTDLRWAADDNAITYKASFGPSWNLWNLPLNGEPPRQITHFENEKIFSFAWSPDGRLALSKGRDSSDVVLIKQQL
ncbi:MAG: hypothetical protein ABIV48_06625, partial [Pyrinomonadaceae bacterium]